MTDVLETEAVENGNGMKDPASAENRRYALHRWVPWVAGFSAPFVDDVIARFLPNSERRDPVVLDPFCGVGTTLVECQRRGVDSVGFEINPYAALASRVKTQVPTMDISSLGTMVADYRLWMVDFEEASAKEGQVDLLKSQPPQGFKSRIPFYSERVLSRVLATLDYAEQLRDRLLRDVFLLAFGSVSVKFSNYSYEPSLASRPGSGKPLVLDAPVADIMCAKLEEMLGDIQALQQEFGWRFIQPTVTVWQDSFFRCRKYLDADSVDLLVTSPPYLNNYHYVRNTRPQLWWLGLINHGSQLRAIEEENVGKFWQTVRDRQPVPLTVKMAELEALVEDLRGRNRERGAYGGPGWANYVASYFNDLNVFARLVSEILQPGGRAVVVVGNSIIQGMEIKVDQILSSIAGLHRLSTEAVDIIRAKRVGSSIVDSSVRKGQHCKAALYDAAVVLARPRN